MHALATAENTRRATPESERWAADAVALIRAADFDCDAALPRELNGRRRALISDIRARVAVRHRMHAAYLLMRNRCNE